MINTPCRQGVHCKCEIDTGRCCWCDDRAMICPFSKLEPLKVLWSNGKATDSKSDKSQFEPG